MKAVSSNEIYSSNGFTFQYIDEYSINVLNRKAKLNIFNIKACIEQFNEKQFAVPALHGENGEVECFLVLLRSDKGEIYIKYNETIKASLDEVNRFIEWLNNKGAGLDYIIYTKPDKPFPAEEMLTELLSAEIGIGL